MFASQVRLIIQNTVLGKCAGKDYHASSPISEKQDRRTRNKDRPDRVVWAPRRGDGSNVNEDQPSSSAGSVPVADQCVISFNLYGCDP